MGKMQRNKGARVEREIVNLHKKHGVYAERVPMSGASQYTHDADIDVYAFGKEEAPMVSEVKARAVSTWKTIDKWLGENDLLFLKANHEEPLVVMPMSSWLGILEKLKNGRYFP